MFRVFAWLCALLLIASVTAVAQTPGKGAVSGMLVTDGVTGQKATPHGWSEELIYTISMDKGIGMGVRTSENPPGWYSMPGANQDYPGFQAGRQAMFSLGYDRIPAFGVNRRVKMATSGEKLDGVAVTTPAHYSVMYDKGPADWGDSPWVGGTDFYQTFIATSGHITRVATKLADKSGDHQVLTLNYAIYEPNDGPPSTWKKISPVRSRMYDKGVDPIIHIYHVLYRSSEVNLTPGKKYAVRFWRDPSSPSGGFALVAHRDKGDGYAGGQLYQGDKPLPEWDAYAYVSGGEPGTIVNHAPVGDTDFKEYSGSATRFGQTFKASGKGLAAVDIIYADGNAQPKPFPVTFRLYDAPGGKAIGRAKVCYGIPLTYQARAAVVWRPGEAALTPGKTYYIEWTFPNSVNSWVLNEDLPGEAYRDGKAMPGKDLAMSVAEYEAARRQ